MTKPSPSQAKHKERNNDKEYVLQVAPLGIYGCCSYLVFLCKIANPTRSQEWENQHKYLPWSFVLWGLRDSK